MSDFYAQIGPQVIKYGRTCLVVVDDDERARGHAERPLFELRKVRLLIINILYPRLHSANGWQRSLAEKGYGM